MADYDPMYEPIVGGHKSFSLEKELREQGRHAAANEVGNDGGRYYEGPQGHPAPGSGSPRRDRVSQSPARSHGNGTPALGSAYGSIPPQHSHSAVPVAALHASVPPAMPYSQGVSAPPTYQTASPPRYETASPSPAPAANFAPRGHTADPYYEPILGGHKTYSWEKELRERGLHASANSVADRGDMHFEGPQGHPAPGSGSPRRDQVSQSPGRGHGGSPFVSDYARSTSPAPGGSMAPPPAYPVSVSQPPVSVAAPVQLSGTSYPLPQSAGVHPVHMQQPAPFATSVSPHRVQASRSPSHAAVPAMQGDQGRQYDSGYEPILGGHKTHSWEKELRERGLHASANRVAQMGDSFFEGPQGHPAPGSGSPRRDRVSASPPRTSLPPGTVPQY
eukprot:TRINITY_DN12089_c0_g1_i1.p1 TRINITY_DN12089_c0_g1~~TRINITY_DN12089_c0_g1_i1.p1  ORF type:complete len:405 (+),score=103.81 TRINITY_DN12089_c0_g1_i1:47-1216(+)